MAPENTLPAVRAALVSGFDYVEVDLAHTADGVPVLMHDRTVNRTTDGTGPLAALTLAALGVGARGLVVDRSALKAHPDAVDDLHAAGLRVVAYTLNSDRQWDAATTLGVDGIVTDDPGLLENWQRGLASD
ncbi:glycerophosphodiester phosphodiesterase [Microbacterium aurum]